jgi:hypothetical protein
MEYAQADAATAEEEIARMEFKAKLRNKSF